MAKKSSPTKYPKHEILIKRLRELGVFVSFNAEQNTYLLQVPYKRGAPVHIEIGFLMAQFDTFVVPEGYDCLSAIESKVIPEQRQLDRPRVRFVESFPTRMNYRIYLSPDEEQADDK